MERFTDGRELDWLIDRLIPDPPLDPERQRELDEVRRTMEDLAREHGKSLDDEAEVLASMCGLDAGGWQSSAWILHAMYETDSRPDGITYDDVDRRERATGTGAHARSSEMSDDERVIHDALSEVLADATLVSVHYSGSPGPEWRRLLWRDLWTRLAIDPVASCDGHPCFSWFPYRSWPVSIAPPGEGSLDVEQLERLLAHLGAVSERGGDTPCIASYGACAIGEFDHDVLYRGALREVRSLFDRDELSGSPSNLWPVDRSWLVYTDWDLWATKVSGPPALVERLERDAELEVVRLPLTSNAG